VTTTSHSIAVVPARGYGPKSQLPRCKVCAQLVASWCLPTCRRRTKKRSSPSRNDVNGHTVPLRIPPLTGDNRRACNFTSDQRPLAGDETILARGAALASRGGGDNADEGWADDRSSESGSDAVGTAGGGGGPAADLALRQQMQRHKALKKPVVTQVRGRW